MQKLLTTDKTLLQAIILMVVLYAWLTLLFAIFGIFYSLAIFIIWVSVCALLYHKKIIIFNAPSRDFLSYILIALSFALIISYFAIPTIFSGRDQGSLSEAAMRLSDNHTLVHHTTESSAFFEINEKGKALNFPGFFYTADGGLITQFPLPYITFISGFFGIFGIYGFTIANIILSFTFVLSILSVARHYMSYRYTLAFALILLSSFSIGWFAKFTLSENITSALLWGALALYLFLKKSPSAITYITLLLTISLLLFTRIEGIWFFVIFTFLIIRNNSIKAFIKKDIWWRVFFPITVLFVVACSVLIINLPFFMTLAKASSGATSELINPLNFLDKTTYLFSIYALYGLILPLLFTVAAVVTAIFSKRYRTLLLPIILVLPLMIYYIFPNISGDHPWMLRRFVFALLPATILVSVLFISYIRSNSIPKRILKYVMLSLLLMVNIPAFVLFINYAENSTLNNQIMILSETFGDNDLILIDKNAAGDGWSMITNPLNSLYNKHAVYFFNPTDLDKINTTNFDNIFLITSTTNKKTYLDTLSAQMNYVTKYVFIVNQLNIQKTKAFPPKFPKKETKVIRGIIYELTAQ